MALSNMFKAWKRFDMNEIVEANGMWTTYLFRF